MRECGSILSLAHGQAAAYRGADSPDRHLSPAPNAKSCAICLSARRRDTRAGNGEEVMEDEFERAAAARKGSPFLNSSQAAHYLGLSDRTLEDMRERAAVPRSVITANAMCAITSTISKRGRTHANARNRRISRRAASKMTRRVRNYRVCNYVNVPAFWSLQACSRRARSSPPSHRCAGRWSFGTQAPAHPSDFIA